MINDPKIIKEILEKADNIITGIIIGIITVLTLLFCFGSITDTSQNCNINNEYEERGVLIGK